MTTYKSSSAHRNARILMMDSGVGGISVYQAIKSSLPSVEVLYVGDNAALPYGERSDEFVLNRVIGIARHYELRYQPDLIVLACNTASTLALPELRSITDIPIVGVVPAIKVAASLTQTHRIGLLATPATIERPYVDELRTSFAPHCKLIRIGSALLVGMAEDKLQGKSIDLNRLAQEIAPFADQRVDVAVLGCTHFPLLRQELESLQPSIQWIDSGQAIARRTAFLLTQMGYQAHRMQGLSIENKIRDLAEFTGELSEKLAESLHSTGFAASIGKVDIGLHEALK